MEIWENGTANSDTGAVICITGSEISGFSQSADAVNRQGKRDWNSCAGASKFCENFCENSGSRGFFAAASTHLL